MNSVANQLQLLCDVLPWFLESIRELISRSQNERLPWEDYTSIRTRLYTLRLPVNDLIQRYSRRKTSPSEQECEATTVRLLLLLEAWTTTGMRQAGEKTMFDSSYKYPGLLAIQRNQTWPTLLQPWPEQERVEKKNCLFTYAETLFELGSQAQDVTNYAAVRSGRPPAGLRVLLGRLHCTLGSSWNCRCRHPHEGMLLLATHGGYKGDGDAAKFSLLLGTTEGLTRWNEAQIFVTDTQRQEPRKNVRWSSSLSFCPPSKPQSTIGTICELIGASEPERLLRLLVNETSLEEAELPAARILRIENLVPSATLTDLLQGPRLTFPCKIVLAVIMAHTFLHLCDTSWLPHPWDKQSFKFLKSEQDLDLDEIVRPFLVARYASNHTQSTVAAGMFHKDQGRLALGVILLEIFRQEPIEASRRDAEDLQIDENGQVTTDTDLFTATRVFERPQAVSWDGHELYRKAVKACLKSAEIDGRPWGDDKHSQYIYDKVVQPLECELEWGCGIAVSDLDKIIISRHGKARSLFNEYTRPKSTSGSESVLAKRQRTAPSQTPHLEDNFPIPSHSRKFPPVSVQELGARQSEARDDRNSVTTSSKKRNWDDISSNDLDSSVHISSGAAGASAQDEKLVPTLSMANCTIRPNPCSMFHVQNSERKNGGPAHEWFTKMENNVHRTISRRGVSTKAPIKVAILDTGVSEASWAQWSQAKATKARVTYLSFVPGDNPNEHIDNVDHGTHTAALLIKVAPHAHISIARVATGGDLEAAESIVKAIEHYTLNDKVDIISMSFGFSPLEQDLETLKRAIRKAHEADIVMFAAGHNSGFLSEIAYPAASDHVICIGSCNGHGSPSSFTPPPVSEMIMFCTLGEDISSPIPSTDLRTMSGTSFATPIAAGIAAVLMDYVVQESQSWSELDQGHAAKIRSKAGIINVFMSDYCSSKIGEHRVLKPWILFNEKEIRFAKSLLLRTLQRTQ